jgi:hypothetical protein
MRKDRSFVDAAARRAGYPPMADILSEIFKGVYL